MPGTSQKRHSAKTQAGSPAWSASDLLTSLGQAPGLQELAANPLLLGMIVDVYRHRRRLPATRAELYAETSQLMLQQEPGTQNRPSGLNGDAKETLLRRIAYEMMERRVRALPRNDILALLRTSSAHVLMRGAAEALLAELETSGLLIETEAGVYGFAHLSFQEYLAAAHIHQHGIQDIPMATAADSWWRETLLLRSVLAENAGPDSPDPQANPSPLPTGSLPDPPRASEGNTAAGALAASGTRVIIVGTGSHHDSGLADLPSVRSAASELAAALIENGGLDPDHLRILLDPPGPDEVLSAITEQAQQAGDLLMIFYIGHGLMDARGELYLATAGTQTQGSHLAPTSVPYSTIRDALRVSPARARMLVLDCGNAMEALGNRDGAAHEPAGSASASGTCVLASGTPSPARTGRAHADLTRALASLLRTGDPHGPATITIDDAYQYLLRTLDGEDRVRIWTSGTIGQLALAANPAHLPKDPGATHENVPPSPASADAPSQGPERAAGSVKGRDTRPYFYLSYPRTPRRDPADRDDPDRWVYKLYKDLCSAILQMTDARPEEAGFMDRENTIGSQWSPELTTALARCRVFVPLYSRRYFESDNCGREWFAFARREITRKARGGETVDTIVPALWTRLDREKLPYVAQSVQFDHQLLGERYCTEGFYGIMKLQNYRADYQRAVTRLAERIIAIGDESGTFADETTAHTGRHIGLRCAAKCFRSGQRCPNDWRPAADCGSGTRCRHTSTGTASRLLRQYSPGLESIPS